MVRVCSETSDGLSTPVSYCIYDYNELFLQHLEKAVTFCKVGVHTEQTYEVIKV